jgi:hypothetical protein
MPILTLSARRPWTLPHDHTAQLATTYVCLIQSLQGDGTVLSASHFLDDSTPLVGINSDPGEEEDKQVVKKTDERRRYVCALSNWLFN